MDVFDAHSSGVVSIRTHDLEDTTLLLSRFVLKLRLFIFIKYTRLLLSPIINPHCPCRTGMRMLYENVVFSIHALSGWHDGFQQNFLTELPN